MRKTMITALLAAALMAAPAAGESVYVNAEEGLNVRDMPGEEGSILEVLPYGTEIETEGEKDGWLEIEHSGQQAYICAEYTQEEDPFRGMEYLGEWRITAYAYTGSPCANGQYPTVGYTVACNSLPFGAEIYIEGVGYRTVEDRGPGWLGDSWCDLYLGDYNECVQWGNQYRGVWRIG